MISTHVLDTSKGNPASGVHVSLERQEASHWKPIDSGITNQDGRYVFSMAQAHGGVYRIFFDLQGYFEKANQTFFFLQAPVIFKIDDTTRKYHVPLLLNPFGYSTYRGS